MTLADTYDPPPATGPPVGYAPRLCSEQPSHYARRDTEAPGVLWECVDCGLRWRTDGTQP